MTEGSAKYRRLDAEHIVQTVQSLAKRLLEAHERGYWNPDEHLLEQIRELVDKVKERFRS